MDTLTMGILAHVDAGKTSLTERLLHAAGVIDQLGSVDAGSTRSDSMELERRRGITIRSAVVSFLLPDPERSDPELPGEGLTVNLIDTPGHSDFIAEVERALSVLDGAVLVISAVEGVQVQTRMLMRTLARLRIPTLVFVNKIDRMGARYDELLAGIRRLLTPGAVAMGSTTGLGTRAARYHPFAWTDEGFTAVLAEVLAEGDDDFLAAYLDGALGPEDYRRELVAQVGRAVVQPVFFGSAMTGEGVPELIKGIRTLLPRATGAATGPLQGAVFKVERGPAGEKLASARLFSGTLPARQYVDIHRPGRSYAAKPASIRLFDRGITTPVQQAAAGRIVQLRGIREIQIGDRLGRPAGHSGRLFSPPTLQTVVRPVNSAEEARLYVALQQLAEQDPLIKVRKTPSHELSVSLYGEVQKEVIASLLDSEYGLAVEFAETQPVLQEQLIGTGGAVRVMQTPANPFWATVGLRVSGAPEGSGIDYRLEVEVGALPRAFHTAIQETTIQSLRQGLYGWEVADCRVVVTHTGYAAPVSTAGDFRRATPLALMEALRRAGTRVCEPFDRFELEVPPDAVAAALAKLSEAGGTVQDTVVGPEQARLTGLLPAGQVHAFETQLPGMSHGEGVLLVSFDGFRPVVGPPPTRPRTDGNPLHQKEYLLHLNNA